MPASPQKHINDALIELFQHIDTGVELDKFTRKKYLETFEKIPDVSQKLMMIALTYGASREYQEAITVFKEAVKYKEIGTIINYLTFLSKINYFELYFEETIRLAKEVNSLRLCTGARNAAYSSGNLELARFFSRKGMSLIQDDDARRDFEMDTDLHLKKLNHFIDVSGLSAEKMAEITMLVSKIARDHDVLTHSNEFYVSSDAQDLAVICTVLTEDADLIADMDIDVATTLAMNEELSTFGITAWYKGIEQPEATV